MQIDFQAINDVRCELGEGPVYDDRREAVWFCDILGRAVHRFELKGGASRRWSFPSEVGSLGLAESGRVVVALRDGVVLFDPESGELRELAAIERDIPETRLNDGKVGPDGAFWVGSMDDVEREKVPIGSLYRVDGNGRVEVKVERLKVSNGLAWSPDGRIMYHSDSRGRWIDRWSFDPETGTISGRTRIAEPDDATGRPDGGATDIEGNYWSAGVSSARLNRFSPDGRLLESVPVPVAAPTMPCFAGPDLRTLFVTSLRVGRSPELLDLYPLTGITISGRSPVAGTPVHRFRDR
jgi:sugar lactone lactonase YvrE